MNAKKLKEMAATTGLATIYGLLFAGLCLALWPNGEIQAQCDSTAPCDGVDCAIPCYTPPQPQPQGPRIFGQGNWDAMDCDDCDSIYNNKITRLTKTRDDAIDDALSNYSTERADAYQDYKNAVLVENARFNREMASASAEFLRTLETKCSAYTLTGAVTTWGGATYVGKKAFQKIRVRTMAILRGGAFLVGGAITSAVCVRAEQRVYDARTEGLMAEHNAKMALTF